MLFLFAIIFIKFTCYSLKGHNFKFHIHEKWKVTGKCRHQKFRKSKRKKNYKGLGWCCHSKFILTNKI